MNAPRGYAILLAIMLAACGASAREKTINASFVAANALRDGFTKWDIAHQQAIVDDAKSHGESKEAVKAAIEVYREKRTPVLKGFADLYQAITTAILVDKDPKSLSNMLAAGIVVKNLVDDIMKITKPMPPGATPSPAPPPAVTPAPAPAPAPSPRSK